MKIRAKRLPGEGRSRLSWFRVHPGVPLDVTFQLMSTNRSSVNWVGHEPRFRIFSQFVDQLVVLEITDPQRCEFKLGGVWRLRLTAEETESLPRGGMRFTLEHRAHDGDYVLGLLGTVSCCETTINSNHNRISSLLPR
ncbi:hypothetical protein [Aporhodopirellula aestuarii]|uniref:Uncharacterized protein n=1 Tax=Aporhodopirellula aestuarii TaxID=2950107 RepID=A0ABT0TZH0_9BACT|nr:hypothetical protein [Aporhodopirellula aestuarii]MCM2369925.1 hypothetical protein [Aporhodopirellula aestuarii]